MNRLIQKVFCAIFLFILLGSNFVHASDVTFDKLTYQISATHFVDSMGIKMAFSAIEVLEVIRKSGVVSIDQKVSGKVTWPTSPGGFTALPYTKYIEFRDNEGRVQKEVKVLPDAFETGWAAHNIIELGGDRVAKDIGDARASEIRFVVVPIPGAGGGARTTSMAWENPYWINLGSRAYLGPGRAAGEEIEIWITKWIPYPGIITPQAVKAQLGSISNVKTAAGSFETLVGGANFRAVHPSKIPTGILELEYAYTFFWDKQTGVLVRFESVGRSINPQDKSETRTYYELAEVKGGSTSSGQPTGPRLPSAPPPSAPETVPQVPPSPPSAPTQTGSTFAPNFTIIGLIAVVGVGAVVGAFAVMRSRGRPQHGSQPAEPGQFKSEVVDSGQAFKASATDFKTGTEQKRATTVAERSAELETRPASKERLEKVIARLEELKAQGKITDKVYEKLLKEYQEKKKVAGGTQ